MLLLGQDGQGFSASIDAFDGPDRLTVVVDDLLRILVREHLALKVVKILQRLRDEVGIPLNSHRGRLSFLLGR